MAKRKEDTKQPEKRLFKTIGFIGDIHCGSHEALWPENEIPSSNKYVITRYLNKCFNHLVESWPELDLLILMGDLIDGKQKKSEGVGLYTTSEGEQCAGAIEVMRPMIAKAKSVARVWGTPYHEGFHGVINTFDAEFGIKTVDQVLEIRLRDNDIMNVAHHPAGGSALYKGTMLDKEAIWASVAAHEKKIHNDTRWIIRGHKHFYGYQETAHKVTCIVPCFQMPTAWAKKQNLFRYQPDLGAMLMTADDSHPFGYRCTPYLYNLPVSRILTPGDII